MTSFQAKNGTLSWRHCFVPQVELRERLAKMYDVKDDKLVSVFGLRTQVRRGRVFPRALGVDGGHSAGRTCSLEPGVDVG